MEYSFVVTSARDYGETSEQKKVKRRGTTRLHCTNLVLGHSAASNTTFPEIMKGWTRQTYNRYQSLVKEAQEAGKSGDKCLEAMKSLVFEMMRSKWTPYRHNFLESFTNYVESEASNSEKFLEKLQAIASDKSEPHLGLFIFLKKNNPDEGLAIMRDICPSREENTSRRRKYESDVGSGRDFSLGNLERDSEDGTN